MALVRFGQGVAEMRGSIAGVTFGRNRSGAYARNRTVPVNPNTQAQADSRYLFSQTAFAYTQLTAVQKEQWKQYAKLTSFFVNKLGESYTPSGRQLFQYCNMNLAIVQATQVVSSGTFIGIQYGPIPAITVPIFDLTQKPDPPTFVGEEKSFSAVVAGGSLTQLKSDANANPPNATDDIQRIIVEATPFVRPSIENLKASYRLITTISVTAATDLDILTSYTSRFEPAGLVVGMRAVLRLSTVNKGGLRSDPVEVTMITK